MLTVCDSLDVSDIVHKVVGGASWSMGGLAVTRKIHTHDIEISMIILVVLARRGRVNDVCV